MDTCRLCPMGYLEMVCVIEGSLVGCGGCGGAVIERVVTCGVVTVLDTPRVLTDARDPERQLINLTKIKFHNNSIFVPMLLF